MSKFTIEIKCDGAAFFDDSTGEYWEPSYEVSRILRDIAYKVDEGYTSDSIMDINGNRVGSFEFSKD